MNTFPKILRFAAVAFGLLLGTVRPLLAVPDSTAPSLVARAGVLGIGDAETVDPVGAIEIRFPTRWAGLQPWAGLNLTDNRNWWGGAGLVYHHDFTPRLRATIGSGPFYYRNDADRDLGLDLEFYSFLELSRELRRDEYVGIRVGHLSNAGLGRRNPGSETFSIVYSRPLRSLTQLWSDSPAEFRPTSIQHH